MLLMGRRQLGNAGIHEIIILKQMLKKYARIAWTAVVWFRTEANDRMT